MRYLIAGLLMLDASRAEATAMANPASLLCASNGGKVEIDTAPNGAQRGICVFADGTRIDEWAYFRNKHRTTK